MKCPRCGQENESGAGFCMNCGTKLVAVEAAPPEPRDNVRKCPQCGQEIEGRAGFCMNCGAKLVTVEAVVPEQKEDPPKCPQCGHEIQSGVKFCANCGAKLEKEEPAPQAAAFVPAPDAGRAEPQPPKRPVQENAFTPAPDAGQTEPKPQWQPDMYYASYPPQNTRPYLQLPTKRGLAKMFFLGIITLGIYNTVIWSRIVTELNITASRYDGKRTMPLTAMWLLAPITLGIYPFVWYHQFCNRVGDELRRRGLNYKFSAATFWLWNILGVLIVVGPLVFIFKLMKAMNKINGDFNVNG